MRRTLSLGGVLVAVVAILASAASAADYHEPFGPRAQGAGDAVNTEIATRVSQAGTVGPRPTGVVGIRSGGQPPPGDQPEAGVGRASVAREAAPAASSDGFDWADAAVGAAAAVVLLAALAIARALRRRDVPAPTSQPSLPRGPS
jgi:hypothetical protein